MCCCNQLGDIQLWFQSDENDNVDYNMQKIHMGDKQDSTERVKGRLKISKLQ